MHYRKRPPLIRVGTRYEFRLKLVSRSYLIWYVAKDILSQPSKSAMGLYTSNTMTAQEIFLICDLDETLAIV
jgi:hypothetical protein